MENMIIWIKMVFGAIAGLVSYMFGGLDVLLKALLICIAIDYATGVLAALYEKRLNSETGFRGIMKKVVILLVVALAYTVGHVVGLDSIRDFVIGFYIANEGISILENAGRMNVPVAKQLSVVLEQLKEKSKGDDE